MVTTFMNLENSKTFDPHWLVLNIAGKIDLRMSNKYVALSKLSFYYIRKNIKNSYKNNKFQIQVSTLNGKFGLLS